MVKYLMMILIVVMGSVSFERAQAQTAAPTKHDTLSNEKDTTAPSGGVQGAGNTNISRVLQQIQGNEGSSTSSQGNYEDTNKVSGMINDLVSDLGVYQKASSAYSAGKTGVQEYVQDGGVGGMYDKAKASLTVKNVVKTSVSAAVPYKSSFQSVLKTINDFISKTASVADQISMKINEWRNTEPAMDRLQNQIKKVAHDGIAVAKSFQWKDLWDINQTFFNKFDKACANFERITGGAITWLTGTKATKKAASLADLFFDNQKVSEIVNASPDNQAAYKEYMSTVDSNDISRIPGKTMSAAFESIQEIGNINDISKFAKNPDDTNETVENHDFEVIEQALNDPGQTYLDAQQIAAFIAQKKEDIVTQNAKLLNLITMQSNYRLRFEMGRVERQDNQCSKSMASYTALSNAMGN